MPFLLAKLGAPAGAGQRHVWVRGEESVALVPDRLSRAPAGGLVLLHGDGPPWTLAHLVQDSPWPPELPGDLATLRTALRPAVTRALGGVLSSLGRWTLDPEGRPCEVGFGRRGGPVLAVINYAGWMLRDLESTAVEVVPCSLGTHEVWVLTAMRVPKPPSPLAAPAAPSPQPTLPAPGPAFDIQLRFAELTFLEGRVQFTCLGRVLTVDTPLAHEVYNDVRGELDNALPGGVRAVGSLGGDDGADCALRGIEELATLFQRVHRSRWLQRALGSPDWLDADELAATIPGVAGGGASALLGVPEFELGKRAEAFRRLFKTRAPGEPVRVLPGRAVVVALGAADGGRPWFAWEKTAGDYATYLFRPRDDEQRNRMLHWARDPINRRRELLVDPVRRADLAFIARVRHAGAGGDELAVWWQRLRRAIGGSET